MKNTQLDFLQDEFMEHMQGPARTGKDDYLYLKSQQVTERMRLSVADWQPPELPSLKGMDEVVLDLETTGLRWWHEDRLIGMGLRTPDGKTRYLPIRHKIGPNIPEEQFFAWIKRELRDKRVVNIRTKFDLHCLRADGIDLEQQGCTFGDVAHYAALLDDHRRLFNQKDLATAFLGIDGKMTEAHGFALDPSKFAEYPAGLVAPRAEGDVETVFQLQQAMWPQLTEQNLHRVRQIEDQLIPAVVEMEHNGVPLDMELLNDWCQRTEREVEDALWDIRRATGCDLATPNKRADIARIFSALHLQMPLDAETSKLTIADDALATYDHPVIFTLRKAIALASLRSKFLLKYQTAHNGILRYELHQLPYQDDAEGGGGAVSGRFSSAAMSYYDANGKLCSEGGNIQQVFGVKSQMNPKRSFNPTSDYIVKKLFKPAAGVWFGSDMRQVEYRRFVHYSNSERLIASYRENPLLDYHQLVHGLILQHTGRDFERTHVKNCNFSQLYGAGVIKLALMVEEISERVYLELSERQQIAISDKNWDELKRIKSDPRIGKTKSLYDTYHAQFPEVKQLLDLASKTAEKRGHVLTIVGSRARFNPGDRMYSALNRAIQGTAAYDNKVTLIDVHKERHNLGYTPRITVHDSLGGDLADPLMLPEMARFLNQPRLECKVPLLWDSGVGASWADAK